MSQINDEIDELYKRQELLMEHLGLEFDYQFNEPVGVIEKKPDPDQAPECADAVPERKKKFISFKKVDIKLNGMHSIEEVNAYEDEIMSLDLTDNQVAVLRKKIIERRAALLYAERIGRR